MDAKLTELQSFLQVVTQISVCGYRQRISSILPGYMSSFDAAFIVKKRGLNLDRPMKRQSLSAGDANTIGPIVAKSGRLQAVGTDQQGLQLQAKYSSHREVHQPMHIESTKL
jgi:hypothetical protein